MEMLNNFPPSYWLAPVVSFMTAFFLLHWMLASGAARLALDRPNHRSLHASPIPRTGGLALMAGVFAGWAAVLHDGLGAVLLLACGLVAVSFLDDVRGLAARWRFLAHFLAAAGFVVCLLPGVGLLPAALLVLAAVWMTNLYNFMDGSDGLAGGMALFGFSFYALAAGFAGDAGFALASLSIATAALAFLMFNFHPARVFLGDAGSIPLGFLAAVLGLLGWHRGLWPLWFPALVFSPFTVDASATLAKRLWRGAKVWQAHREHYYQRLVQMGWGHRNTALAEYALMAAAGGSAVWGGGQSAATQVGLLAAWVVIYLILMRTVDVKWRLFSRLTDAR